jgi:hypothetical protein
MSATFFKPTFATFFCIDTLNNQQITCTTRLDLNSQSPHQHLNDSQIVGRGLEFRLVLPVFAEAEFMVDDWGM